VVRASQITQTSAPEAPYDDEHSWKKKSASYLPIDVPETLVDQVVQHAGNVDVRLYPDMLTSCSVTATWHWLNQMLVDWYWKKQDKVEYATYGSEVAAPRIILIDQNIVSSIAITLRRYQDVSVQAPPRTFDGNKESDVSSMGNHVSSHVKMHKRRNILQRHITMFPFHRVQEAIDIKKLMTLNVKNPEDNNPDDVPSKTWNNSQAWLTLKPGLFLRRQHDGLLCSNGGPDSLRQMGSDKMRCVRRVTNQVPSSSIR
jgi:hypothetical protein